MNAPVRMEHTPPQGVRFHPFAELFPWLEGAALDALRDDIRANGVREPVVFLGDAILDGRNRYMCARDLGIEYPRREFGSDPRDGTDPLAFVVSLNLARRHLSESQRAGVAAKLANLSDGQTAAKVGKFAQPDAPPPVTIAQAAELLNVSERSVRTARKVQAEAPPEVARAVDTGHLPVSLAAKVADLPEEVRETVAATPPEEMKAVAREAVKPFVANNSGNNEWYTPAYILDAARSVLGRIDLDPASSPVANATVQAARFFTAEDDGLAQEWPVGCIWMNPPYAQPLMGQFAAKYSAEIRKGSTGIVLVNNATETVWFQTLAQVSSAVCFPQARIRFVDPSGVPSGAPLQGQAILYAGENPDKFAAAFGSFGVVLRHG